MKCVKNNLTGEVKRVSDDIAATQVAFINKSMGTALWSYCPKSEWKALRVKPVEVIVHTDDQKREIQRKADKRKQANLKKNTKPVKYN